MSLIEKDAGCSDVLSQVVCLTLLPGPSSGKYEHLGFVRDVKGNFFSLFSTTLMRSDASATSPFLLGEEDNGSRDVSPFHFLIVAF